MHSLIRRPGTWALTSLLAASLPLSAAEDENYELLKQQVEALQSQLAEVQQALEQYENQGETQYASKQDVAELRQDVAAAAEWKEPSTLIHMAGYADVGYSNQEKSDGSFNVGSFSPIFHYQYRDIVMLESELEMKIADDGETDIALEYLTIDYFLNDYVTLIGGKFLSPIGQFRQNIHPSWVNKLASAPPGFGHDGAAPVSDVGFQARGGFGMGSMFANYSAYVSNGPELIATVEDDEIELEGIEAEGFGKDRDGEKVFGGRFAILPVPGLEIGLSAASGKAAVTSIAGGHGVEPEEPDEHDEGEAETGDEHGEEAFSEGAIAGEPARDYDVLGFDFAWRLGNFAWRGEYVKTEVGEDHVGVTASEGATWETWYTQVSYQFPQTKWEPVLRYADFDSPHSSQDQKQWAVGLNYLFTGNFIGKMTYEFNDGLQGTQADTDRWMFQLAYGF